jgi:hypothetical protein
LVKTYFTHRFKIAQDEFIEVVNNTAIKRSSFAISVTQLWVHRPVDIILKIICFKYAKPFLGDIPY